MLPALQIAAAAVLFSTGGAAIKWADLGGWEVAGGRSLVAGFSLFLLSARFRGAWSGRVILVAVSYASALVLFVLSTKNTTAGNAIFLQSTAPLYVLVLSPLLLKEPVGRSDIVLGGVILLGLGLIVGGGSQAQSTAPAPILGNVLGVACGGFWALTLVGLRWLGRSASAQRDEGACAVVAGNFIAFALSVPWASDWTAIAHPENAAVLAYLGVVQIAAPYALLTHALRTVPAYAAALLILLEPAFNPIWAWWVHGEKMGATAALGGAFIVAATASKSGFDQRVRALRSPPAGKL